MTNYLDYENLLFEYNFVGGAGKGHVAPASTSSDARANVSTEVGDVYQFYYLPLTSLSQMEALAYYDTPVSDIDTNQSTEDREYTYLPTVSSQKDPSLSLVQQDTLDLVVNSADTYSVTFSDVAEIAFSVGDTSTADIVIGATTSGGGIGPTTAAYELDYSVPRPNHPYPHLLHGDIWINNDYTAVWDSSDKGALAHFTFLQEISHALGIDLYRPENRVDPSKEFQPDPGEANYNPLKTQYQQLDSHKYSITTYNFMGGMEPPGADNEVAPFGLQLIDIAAIQAIYGRDYTTRATDTTYSKTTAFASNRPNDAFIYTIWDGGGTADTIDVSGYTNKVILDLRQGEFSSVGQTADASYSGTRGTGLADDNLSIAYFTVIENATGTLGDDLLVGNAWNNTLDGGEGHDKIYGGGYVYGDETIGVTADAGFSLDDSNRPGPSAAHDGSGNDTLLGGIGDDNLYGGYGFDILKGGSDNDDYFYDFKRQTHSFTNVTLYDSDGWDYIDDASGSLDHLYITGYSQLSDLNFAEHGNDLVIFKEKTVTGTGPWVIQYEGGIFIKNGVNGSPIESIFIGGTEYEKRYFDPTDSLYDAMDLGTIPFITLTPTQDQKLDDIKTQLLALNPDYETLGETITGGSGDDTLVGGEVGDDLTGGLGDDVIASGGSADIVDAGAGEDQVYGGTGDDDLDGGTEDDELYGEDGHDTIDGGSGADIIKGGSGDDNLDGGSGNDTIRGGSGFNYIVGDSGNEDIKAGDDDDIIYGDDVARTAFAGIDTIDAGNGDDTAYGGDGNDDIEGKAGFDTLFGDGGDDTVHGGDNDDVIYGDDLARTAYTGADTLSGGLGSDTIYGGAGDDIIYGESTSIDTTDGGDTLIGDDGADTINGGFGDDIIYGDDEARTAYSGIDILTGHAGNDTIYGGAGNDTIHGDGPGVQTADSGDDLIYADAGDDTVNGNDGNDTIYGGTGNDDIDAGTGVNTVYGEDGNDDIDAINDDASGTSEFYGGAGDDQIIVYGTLAGVSNVILDGGTGDDYLAGGDEDTTYIYNVGYGADEFFDSYDGTNTDYILFGAGITEADLIFSDYLLQNVKVTFAGNATDEIILKAQSDTFVDVDTLTYQTGERIEKARFDDGSEIWLPTDVGTSGNDTFYETEDDDVIYGYAGNDYIRTFGGDDILRGGAGDDELLGQNGNDLYVFEAGFGIDSITNDKDGSDTLKFEDSNIHLSDLEFTEEDTRALRITVEDGVNEILITKFRDPNGIHIIETIEFADGSTFDLSNYLSNWTVGTSSTDFITGSASLNDVIFANGGDDTLNGLDGNDTLSGGSGADTLSGGLGDDLLLGGAGNDTLAGLEDADTIYGGDGADNIGGFEGNDTLYGEDGNDVLDAVSGNDTSDGGLGDDAFLHTSGIDTVSDSGGTDILILSGGTTINDITLAIENTNDLRITINAGTDEVLVKNQTGTATADHKIETLAFDDGFTTDLVNFSTWTSGTTSGDTITASAGADVVYALAGADTVNAGTGDDSVHGGDGDDILNGEADNDQLFGGAGIDTISGGDGDDIISGGAGDDILSGGAGDDTYLFATGDGTNTITEDGGFDTIDLDEGIAIGDITFNQVGDDLEVTIASGFTITDFYLGGDNVVEQLRFSDASTYDLTSLLPTINVINGTIGNDTIAGTSGDDEIHADAGDDTVDADDGNDILYGGVGEDMLYGEGGNDSFIYDENPTSGSYLGENYYGGSGTDSLDLSGFNNGVAFANNGLQVKTQYDADARDSGTFYTIINNVVDIETLIGTDYADNIAGRLTLDNTIEGGLGNDILQGNDGNDVYIFNVGDGDDLIIDSDGTSDEIHLGAGITSGDLTLTRSGDDLEITFSGTATDKITIQDQYKFSATPSNNTDYIEKIVFDDASELLLSVTETGTTGDDTLTGSMGNDYLDGDDGNDTLQGGDGYDFIYGGNGDDLYVFDKTHSSGTHSEYVYGEAGTDTADFSAYGHALYVSLAGSANPVRTHYDSDATDSGTFYVLVNDLNSFEAAIGTNYADRLHGSNATSSTDALRGESGNDKVYGHKGDDTLSYIMADNTSDSDIYYGNQGLDTLQLYFTTAEYTASVQTEITNYESFIASNYNTSQNYGPSFTFSAFDLTASGIEELEVYVDGVLQGGGGGGMMMMGGGGGGLSSIMTSGSLALTFYGNFSMESYSGTLYLVSQINGNVVADVYHLTGEDFDADEVQTLSSFYEGEGDIIDISELLSGYDPLNDVISDFISLTEADGDTTVAVDKDGLGTDYSFGDAAILENQTDLVLADMISNGSIYTG